MKKSSWVLYLFESEEKKNILKIMEFRSVKDISYVLDIEPQVISNFFHGLIKPRGILKNCVLYQSARLEIIIIIYYYICMKIIKGDIQ